MRYFGGKQRIARHICKFLNEQLENNKLLTYLEPFVGSGAIMTYIECNDRTGSDINPSLIMLLNEVRDGSFNYPEHVSEEMYRQYKDDPNDSAMKAFIGFGCSFAGKWFGGYARRSKGDSSVYNFSKAAALSLSLRRLKVLVV